MPTPYYPISSPLSVKWLLTEGWKQRKIFKLLAPNVVPTRGGCLQEVWNIVIWLRNIWYARKKLVAEERCSLMKGVRSRRFHWIKMTKKQDYSTSINTLSSFLIFFYHFKRIFILKLHEIMFFQSVTCRYPNHRRISRTFLLQITVSNQGCGLSARTSDPDTHMYTIP